MIIIALAILVLWWIFRENRKKEILLEYRYKLYKLRDDIRYTESKDPEASKENVVFFYEYLEFSIVKVIDNLHYITLPNIFIFHLLSKVSTKYKRDNDKVEELEAQIKHFLKHSKQNKKYQKLYNEYGQLLIGYFIERHFMSLIITTLSALPILGSIKMFQKLKSLIRSEILLFRLNSVDSEKYLNNLVLK